MPSSSGHRHSSRSGSGHRRHHRRQHQREQRRDDDRRHRRRSSSSSSASAASSPDRGGGSNGIFASAGAGVHVARIGNEQDRERRVADIEADNGFRPAAFVSSRAAGGGGSGGGGGNDRFAKLLSERGHDSAIFGRSSDATAATAAAANAAVAEAATASGTAEVESGTEAARVRALMHPCLVKDPDRSWDEYRERLANLLRLRST